MPRKTPSLCIVSKSLAPYRVNFYNEVALALKTQGWRVTLLVAKSGADDHPWADASGRHEALEIVEVAGKSLSASLQRFLAKHLRIRPTLPNRSLFRWLETEQPDVVWTHEYSPFCLAAAHWAAFRDKISILSSDLGDMPPAYAATRWQLHQHRAFSFLYQGVIAQTMEATRRSKPENAPVHFAPHAIDTQVYLPAPAPAEGPFRFLFAGALSKRKGLDSLIAAGRILDHAGADFEIRVVGTGPMAEWLAAQQESWLSIAGFREGADLIGEYQSAHAYVLPTRGDTYAVTVHEAAASGLPLIIGREAGAAETLVEEGVSGFAIDPDDVDLLAERMRELMDNRLRARDMGNQARKLAEHLDVKLVGGRAAGFILKFARPGFRESVGKAGIAAPQRLRGNLSSSLPAHAAAPSVAALFVTMDRSETARICLERLAAQTRRPDGVFVIDNASTDDTGEVLAAFAEGPTGLDLRILTLAENLGNAGGMEIGMEAAFTAGFASVWILDDDSWPEPEALERLLAPELPPEAVRSSRVIDLATGSLSWPLQLRSGKGWRLVEGADPLPDEPVLSVRRSWLGALIPRQVYESVGPIEGRLFLRGEDEDYPRRIERAGFPVYMIRSSLLHHPPAGPLNRWHLFGREVVLESGLTGDKLYYRLRNSWWMARREYGSTAAIADALLCFFALTCWQAPSLRWIPVWLQAFRDAQSDRLGVRRNAPREMDRQNPDF